MTNEQKIRISSLRRTGCGYTAIARELGLSQSAIRIHFKVSTEQFLGKVIRIA